MTRIDRAIARDGLQGIIYARGLATGRRPISRPRLLSSSRPGRKPSSEAAVQAQAMGTPVIAANAGAAPETVLAPPLVEEASRTGFLIRPGDAAALAVAIAHVLSLGASASGQLSRRARKHVEARFSTESVCAETLERLCGLAARPRALILHGLRANGVRARGRVFFTPS